MNVRAPSFLHRACPRAIAAFALVALASVALPGAAAAQPAGHVHNDFQQWEGFYVEGKLDRILPGLLFFSENQLRRANTPQYNVGTANAPEYVPNSNTTWVSRWMLGYQLNPVHQVWLGFLYQPTFFDNPALQAKKNVGEVRVFQQFNENWTFGRFGLGLRTRIEERYRFNGPGSTDVVGGTPQNGSVHHTPWAFRAREQVRVTYRVGPEKKWFLLGTGEVFVNLNNTSYVTRAWNVDQTRLFAGIGYDPNPRFRMEAGYLWQYVHRYTDATQYNHALVLNVFYRFDWQKKEASAAANASHASAVAAPTTTTTTPSVGPTREAAGALAPGVSPSTTPVGSNDAAGSPSDTPTVTDLGVDPGAAR